VAEARGEQAFVHAMLVRLRDFSSVNVAHGTARGDGALVAVADRMLHFARDELRAPWLVARVAGDAFLFAAAEAVSRERWQRLAEELARQIRRPVVPAAGPRPLPIRLRPRIALSRSTPGEPPERMLSRLLEALEMGEWRAYRATAWVDGSLLAASRGGAQLEADLAAALEHGQIEIVYQPQFSCSDGRMTGAEALARWRHPALGQVGPETLFAIAERAELVPQVSRHIIRTALAGARDWPAGLRLSLNVTAADLSQCEFDRALADALAETGFAPERLTLEITESALVAELERTARRLRRLTATGMRIALDDFGAGFCNFRYLKLLPLAGLKLDRSMVHGITEDARDLAVLRGIVAMARALGLPVVAEGIETEAQRAIVAAEGCADWQGFLGAQPMATAAFARLAEQSR
jgi:EAL domain-containing protein (putative c-di-GMP-specific phosphodiesterase class I)/GGDEF domain-containing protein